MLVQIINEKKNYDDDEGQKLKKKTKLIIKIHNKAIMLLILRPLSHQHTHEQLTLQ